MARALVGQLAHAEHLGLQRRADGIEQVRQRRVARPFPGRAARGAYPPKLGEVRLYRRRQSRIRARHPSSSLLPPRAGGRKPHPLRRHQRGEREQRPQPQRRRTARPQIGQQRAQRLPAARRALLGHRESRAADHRSRSPFSCTVPHPRCGRRHRNDCREGNPVTLGSRGSRVPAQPPAAPRFPRCVPTRGQDARQPNAAEDSRIGRGSGSGRVRES